mmetsp:Transcript_131301/g.365999  ORF Transcript_131301/g.365999 Transcript_131301/m.365999 type:complete len:200 (+) Transcript_131301:1-600(+)
MQLAKPVLIANWPPPSGTPHHSRRHLQVVLAHASCKAPTLGSRTKAHLEDARLGPLLPARPREAEVLQQALVTQVHAPAPVTVDHGGPGTLDLRHPAAQPRRGALGVHLNEVTNSAATCSGAGSGAERNRPTRWQATGGAAARRAAGRQRQRSLPCERDSVQRRQSRHNGWVWGLEVKRHHALVGKVADERPGACRGSR